MKLKRIAINRLPGIIQPFDIRLAGAGFNVVYGPNGIGKSSICRAVEGLYWDDLGSSQRTSVNGNFELEGEDWRAERRGSVVQWKRSGEDSTPPIFPASHNHRCFFLRLRDLIDPSLDGTQDIASQIRRQMSGGFDLNQIRADLFAGVGARHGRRARSDFNKATQEVQEAEGKQFGIQRRADRLDILKKQLGAADVSETRLTSVERALGLAGRREEYSEVAEKLAVLPVGLAKLTGKEVEQIDRIRRQIDVLNERVRAFEGQRDAACDIKRGSCLAAPLASSEIAIWRENADRLNRIELGLEVAKAEYSANQKELSAVLHALGGSKAGEINLNLAEHGQLFEFLRAAEFHKARVKAIEERLRLLKKIENLDEDQSKLEKFRSAAAALRSWLRAPETVTLAGQNRGWRIWIFFAIALAVVGAGLSIVVDTMFGLLAAVGAGIAIPVIMSRSPRTVSGAGAAARNAFVILNIEEPDAWDIPSVEARLRRLESEIVLIDSRMQRSRDRDVERQTLKNELDGLSETEISLDIRRQKLIKSLKLDSIPPDAELVDMARTLDQVRLARIKKESAAGKVEDLQARHRVLLSDIARVLECHGEPRPKDAEMASAFLNSLTNRNSGLVQAISDEQKAIAQLEQVIKDRKLSQKSVERIYSEVGLNENDLVGLTVLLNSLPNYLGLKDTAMRLEGQIELDQAELEKTGETELTEYDRPKLERLQAELSKAANEAINLRNDIAEINAQVNEAKSGSNVLNLIAMRDEARTKLLERRDEALFAKAGKFLIDEIEAEYEQKQMPRVLERARSHFSVFTHYKYKLSVSEEAQAPRLIAIEQVSDERRALDELSDGTRAQLLLAARIAFAEEVEQGKALPLFLDEALDQSDPDRFEAIVRSLGKLAKDQDRQIFYLTSDPGDINRIRHALAKEKCTIVAEIDLGTIRSDEVSVKESQVLYVEARSAVPAPNGLSLEAYGVALGVSKFLPATGFKKQHFFYILSDDLDQLYEFLVNQIEQVGQWKLVSGTPFADKLCSGSISSREIEFRVNLLDFFCEAWKQGRGRSVDREVLAHSGALSERFLDDVATIAAELDGDPEKLLAAFRESRDSRLKGFRKNSIEGLERYLRDNRYLDDRSVLSQSELTIRGLASPAANELPEGNARDCLNRWWHWAERMSCSE